MTDTYVLMDGTIKGATNMELLDNWYGYLYVNGNFRKTHKYCIKNGFQERGFARFILRCI